MSHLLKLKAGVCIMLLMNLDPKKGFLNGKRMLVNGLHSNFINVQIITGSKKGQ
jgi:hypothetical protein